MPASVPATEPLDRRSSGEQAATYIKRLIFEQRLRAGDRVPQETVAHTLGISRIPVREALIALDGEGWVTLEVHRGAFVNGFDEDAVRDHYAMFGLIYGLAARRALARANDHTTLADELDTIIRGLGKSDNAKRAQRVALDFHHAIVVAARSQRIRAHVDTMSGLIPGNFFAEVPGTIPVERVGLAAIARAVRANDADGASAEYEAMIDHHADLAVELFRNRGFFE
jgi:Transcriptional regulators